MSLAMEPRPDVRGLVSRALRPPLKDFRFWVVQLLVLAIAATQWFLLLGGGSGADVPVFAPVALYAVPVVYAALNFGLSAALATTLWIAALTLPSLLLRPSPTTVWAECLELGTISVIAAFVGDRVEREVIARTAAERSEQAMSRSEAQFRTLFEAAPAPILLLDEEGSVHAANPAAAGLFERAPGSLMGSTLSELVGSEEAARRIVEGGGFELSGPDGRRRYWQAFAAAWPDQGPRRLQLAFLDVSQERRRLGRVDAYAASILRAHEEERRRIAQEVHDEPVQALIHLCRRLDLVAAEESLPRAARAALADLRLTAENVNDELRRLARGLRPPSLDDLGLLATVRRLLNDFESRSRVRSQLSVEGENRRLEPEVELGLFRILQEALRNVERHARAHEVSVKLRLCADVVEIEVEDDGVGFRPDEGSDQLSHLGLVGMQERAMLLGGSLRIESTPGRGTLVQAGVPVGMAETSAGAAGERPLN